MLIAFALNFIGVIIVFANYKPLRNMKFLLAFSVPVLAFSVFGFYLLITSRMDNPFILMVLISPLIALLLMEMARWVFRKLMSGQEIILYLGGFLPKSFEERFVSRMEKMITLLITVMALLIPFLLVYWMHK